MQLGPPSVGLGWLSVAFVCGIRAGAAVPTAPLSWLAGALCLVAATGGRGRLVALAVCFLLGGARVSADHVPRPHAPAAVDDRTADQVHGTVVGPPEDRLLGGRFVVAAHTPVAARVLVTVRDSVRPPVLPGDRVSFTARLRTPRGYRVPGAGDTRRWARARGGSLVASVAGTSVKITGHTWSPWRWPAQAQRQLSDAVAARHGDAAAKAVVRGMVIGDRGGIADDVAERFRAAGASHLLAVSGLHLAVVALMLFAVVRWSWAAVPALAGRCRANLVAAAAAWPAAVAYTCATGARVSTVRALLVVSLVLLGVAMARRVRVIDALGASAVVLLVLSPSTLYDPAFQLSFSATAVLCLAMPRRAAARAAGPLGRLYHYARTLVGSSVWATLATAPFTALAFGTVSPGGVVANVVAVPIAELFVLPVGLLGALSSQVSPSLGGWLVDGAVAAAELMLVVVDAVAAVAPILEVPAPRWWELALCAVAIAAGIGWARQRVAGTLSAGIIAACVAGLAGSWVVTAHVAPAMRDDLRVSFVDVGQGDAAVVELPGGAVWLIDSGGRPFVVRDQRRDEAQRQRLAEAPGERAVLAYLRHRRVRRIDRVILTHPHPDHYVGLAAVARALPIGEVWVARHHPDRAQNVAFVRLLWQLSLTGTRVVSPALGPHDHGPVRVTVLHPADDGRVASADPALDDNDNSLVVRIDFAGRRLLFLGDVEEEAEDILVDEVGAHRLAADVVKVPHHGSRTSSSQRLVDAIGARWAVVSCGVANRFGFPSPAVVNRWRRRGARVVRTDRGGTITATVSAAGALRVTSFDR